MRVLVVEDELRYRELIERLLSEIGCNPVGVRTGHEALEACAQHEFDAIILDLNLPVLGGVAFLEKLRAAGCDVPVIVLTAHGSLGSAQEAIRLGISDYLTKPCHLGELERAIGSVRRDRVGQHAASLSPEASDARKISVGDDAGFELSSIERRTILEALNATGGNKTEAAQVLGISRRTLYNRLKAYEMQFED